MDKVVNIRMFRVDQDENTNMGFSTALRHIEQMSLADREHELEPELVVRMERLENKDSILCGEVIRLQSGNLPPELKEELRSKDWGSDR